MKYSFLLILLFSFEISIANPILKHTQISDTTSPLVSNRNLIKFTPLKIADFSNPAIQIDYELITSPAFSTQLSASYLMPSTLYNNYKDIKGFKIGIEERYYLKKQNPTGIYIAFSTDYLKSKYSAVENFLPKEYYEREEKKYDDIEPKYSDTVTVNKHFLSIAIKGGWQFPVKNNLYFDIYAGLGVRFKEIIFSDKAHPEDVFTNKNFEDVFSFTREEGKRVLPIIPLNISLCYRF